MRDEEPVRRIRDSVHGTIDVFEREDRVINHPWMQRLRRIRQTGFLSYVFPGATHSRFEHSIGTMHLAAKAFDSLRLVPAGDHVAANKKTSRVSLADEYPTFNAAKSALRLAALMHDVGHPPFSHSGESLLPCLADILRAFDGPDYLAHWLRRLDPAKAVRHEVFSALMMEKILTALALPARDVIAILVPSIGLDEKSPLNGWLPCLHQLLAEEIDVDRMDYLIRDSRECGVVYGIFDAGRLLEKLRVYEQDGELNLALSATGIPAYEDYLRARQSMYLQVYFHKTSVAADAMLSFLVQNLGSWRLPSDIEAYAAIDEWNIYELLKAQLPSVDLQSLWADLFLHRRLWKLAEEQVFRGSAPKNFQTIPGATLFESANHLTRYHPSAPTKGKLRIHCPSEDPSLKQPADLLSFSANEISTHVRRWYRNPLA